MGISFLGTVDGAAEGVQSLAVLDTDKTTFGKAVGGTTALESVTTGDKGTVAIDGGQVKTSGIQTYGGAVSLGADTKLEGTSGSLNGGVVGNDHGLTLTFSEITKINGGNFSGLASLTSNGGGETKLSGTITTTAGQTYSDAVMLTDDTTLAGTDVAFGSTLDGAYSLTVNASEATTFGGAVGGTTALKSLATDAVGTTAINGGSIRTTDAAGQVFGDAVTLGANTTLAAVAGAITLSGTLDGAYRLDANTTGATKFSGAVGSKTALTHLETNAGGTTAIDGGSIKTSSGDSQFFNDAVTLGANTLLDAGSGAITFADTVNGAFSLTANTTGTTTFGGAVGGSAILTSLVTDAGGSTAINGGGVTTTGAQTYGDAVTLGADTTLAGVAITLASTVDGAKALTINDSGTTTFGGAVGGSTALTSLVTDAGGSTAINGGSIKTTDAAGQVFGDAVTLGANTTLAAVAGAITLSGTLDGAYRLDANTTGATKFSGAVGSKTALTHLETNAGGTTAIDGGSIKTSSGDSQFFNDAVTLGANTLLDAGSGAITFADTVNGAFSLTANTTGTTTFGGAVGGSAILTSLVTDAGGSTAINGGGVTTTGAQTYGDAVTLGADTTLAGVAITLASTVDGAKALTINDSGTTTFGGAVGGSTALTSLVTDAGGSTAINGGSIKTTDAAGQVFGDAVTIGAATTFTTLPSGKIKFTDTLDGAFATEFFAGTGTILFGGTVGGTTALAGMKIGSAASATAEQAINLDGSVVGAATDGLSLAAGVNNASFAQGGAISGFSGDGVVFAAGSTGSAIVGLTVMVNGKNGIVLNKGDYAGTLIRGNTIKKNAADGLVLDAAGATLTNLTIGGKAAGGEGNTISGNTGNGLRTSAGSYSGTVIQGNTISDNTLDGVFLDATGGDGIDHLLIGLTTIYANAILQNGGNGIRTTAGVFTGTTIAGNSITDNGDSTAHTGDGILILGSQLLVGTTSAPAVDSLAANTISGNAANGIRVVGVGAVSNTILSNSIFLNGYVDGDTVVGEGIALVDGGNGSLAAPTVLSAAQKGKTVFVNVAVTGAGTYLAQVFANSGDDAQGLNPPDAAGFEGRKTIASVEVTGNTNTIIEVSADLLFGGDWITATVTTLTGTTPAGTSPFSVGNRLLQAPATVPAGTAEAAGPAIKALAGARLYDAKTGEVRINVGDDSSNKLPLNSVLTSVYTATFAQNYVGGLRVTAADIDQDGYDDLITIPAGIPSWVTPQAAPQFRRAYAADLGTVGIFSGNPDGVWKSASFKTGGLPVVTVGQVFVSAVDLGSSKLPEIVLTGGASKTTILAFANTAPQGARPAFSSTPAMRSAAFAGVATGLTGGVFSADNVPRVAVATLSGGGTTLTLLQPAAGQQLAVDSAFPLRASYTPGKAKPVNIFAAGATLAVGDFDGGTDGNDQVDLLVGAGPGGWANFRIIPGETLVSKNQSLINNELAGKADSSTYGAPKAFYGPAEPYTANGRLTLWAADSDLDAKVEVFAAIGSSNRTSLLAPKADQNRGDLIRRIAFTGSWQTANAALSDGFVTLQTTVPGKGTRFLVRSGVNLG